ncbi:ADAMTS-like protein 2 [Lates japonicus]|uniref:ADAMTS-like protein 2 n=1 Tax=Lates japonicus TaxID=270547 RepID=A0AAD3RJQ6_LATJO|nr:ADAMTS-like protein 2 [Lates japonicus]GLD73035.1 ADAMTS-like protein 2 [Lates japonicus]
MTFCHQRNLQDSASSLDLVEVWNQNGRTPYITYEYTVLRDSLPPIPPPPVYTGSDTSAGEVSVEMGSLLSPNSSLYDPAVPQGQLDPGAADGQKGQETNEVYEETAAIDCDQDGAAAPKFTEGNSSHAGSTANPAPAGGPLDTGPDSPNLIWRVLLDGRINPDELFINISTNQLLTEGDGLFSSEVGPVEVDLSLEREFGLNETLEYTLGRKRNDSADTSYQNKTVQSGGRTSSRSNRTRLDEVWTECFQVWVTLGLSVQTLSSPRVCCWLREICCRLCEKQTGHLFSSEDIVRQMQPEERTKASREDEERQRDSSRDKDRQTGREQSKQCDWKTCGKGKVIDYWNGHRRRPSSPSSRCVQTQCCSKAERRVDR